MFIFLALQEAKCGESVLGVVEHLVKSGADPNVLTERGASALTRATLLGSTELIKCLLEAGADPNRTSNRKVEEHYDELTVSAAHACCIGKLKTYIM